MSVTTQPTSKAVISPENVQHISVGTEVTVKYQTRKTIYTYGDDPSYVERTGVIVNHKPGMDSVQTEIEQSDGDVITIDTFPELGKYGWVFSPYNSLGSIVEVYK